MLIATLVAALAAAEVPRAWHCRNELEVWCTADGCAAAGEFTPMDIWADPKGGVSVCAYSGCWEGAARPRRVSGRLLWTAEDAPFSTARDGEMSADITLLVFETDGVGFVRAGGLATPLLCERASPEEYETP